MHCKQYTQSILTRRTAHGFVTFCSYELYSSSRKLSCLFIVRSVVIIEKPKMERKKLLFDLHHMVSSVKKKIKLSISDEIVQSRSEHKKGL